MISVLTTSKKALASCSAFGLHIPVMIAQIWRLLPTPYADRVDMFR